MTNENESVGPFIINHEKIVETKSYLKATRLLAAHFSYNQYLSIKDFMNDLSTDDLNSLMEMGDNKEIEELILISEMLAVGEGLENSEDDETVMKRIGMLYNFLLVESLGRKKMIKIYRENMSFGDDYEQKAIAEKL
jgi:hypothetical protein